MKKENNITSPSPEARVDWEKEANHICGEWYVIHYGNTGMTKNNLNVLESLIAKALSAAFEKGREAR
jgi:hypothetical protein